MILCLCKPMFVEAFSYIEQGAGHDEIKVTLIEVLDPIFRDED